MTLLPDTNKKMKTAIVGVVLAVLALISQKFDIGITPDMANYTAGIISTMAIALIAGFASQDVGKEKAKLEATSKTDTKD